jgi:hypothetical protein
VAGSCKYSHEPLGSGAMELVSKVEIFNILLLLSYSSHVLLFNSEERKRGYIGNELCTNLNRISDMLIFKCYPRIGLQN